MKHSEVCWLSDDIVPIHSNSRALPFPTSPRIIEGSSVPWLPPGIDLVRSPLPKDRPKVQIPSSSILPRVSPSAKVSGLFLCTRKAGVDPSIKPAGFFDAFVGICKSGLNGRHFGQRSAYHVQLSPLFMCSVAAVYLSRVRTFMHLARTVPIFRFEMGSQISENALLLLSIWTAQCKPGVQNSVDSFNVVPAVGATTVGKRSTNQ